ncbi:MAG: ion transporter [Stenotrophobium sp.]
MSAGTPTSAASQSSQSPGLLAVLAHIPLLDWSMLLLALISVALVGYETWGHATPAQTVWILRADNAACAIFAAEFLWRWRQAGWRAQFVARNWYDVLGMIPVSTPAFRGFRLFRVVRIVIMMARFGMAADRALGEEFTYRVVNRFSSAIVDAISTPITLGVLDEVAEVLGKGTFTHNIAGALAENDRELRALIADKLRENPRTHRLTRLPFYNDIVETISDTSLQIVRAVLNDPRTDELVADMLRENIQQLRSALRDKQAARRT